MSPRDQLSQREVQVATMVWEGKTNPEIATVLGSTEQVVKNQLRGIFDKLEYGAGSNWLSTWLPMGDEAGRQRSCPPSRRKPQLRVSLP